MRRLRTLLDRRSITLFFTVLALGLTAGPVSAGAASAFGKLLDKGAFTGAEAIGRAVVGRSTKIGRTAIAVTATDGRYYAHYIVDGEIRRSVAVPSARASSTVGLTTALGLAATAPHIVLDVETVGHDLIDRIAKLNRTGFFVRFPDNSVYPLTTLGHGAKAEMAVLRVSHDLFIPVDSSANDVINALSNEHFYSQRIGVISLVHDSAVNEAVNALRVPHAVVDVRAGVASSSILSELASKVRPMKGDMVFIVAHNERGDVAIVDGGHVVFRKPMAELQEFLYDCCGKRVFPVSCGSAGYSPVGVTIPVVAQIAIAQLRLAVEARNALDFYDRLSSAQMPLLIDGYIANGVIYHRIQPYWISHLEKLEPLGSVTYRYGSSFRGAVDLMGEVAAYVFGIAISIALLALTNSSIPWLRLLGFPLTVTVQPAIAILSLPIAAIIWILLLLRFAPWLVRILFLPTWPVFVTAALFMAIYEALLSEDAREYSIDERIANLATSSRAMFETASVIYGVARG